MSEGVSMDEFLDRIRRDQQRRNVIPPDPPRTPPPAPPSGAAQRVERLDVEPRDRFMPFKLIGIGVWGVICLIAFFMSPGVGAAGAAMGLFYAVLSGTFERKPSPPVLFDIERNIRRR